MTSSLRHGASNYDKHPVVQVTPTSEGLAWQGWPEIVGRWRAALGPSGVLTIDCYPGVDLQEIVAALGAYWPELALVFAEEACLPAAEVNARIAPDLTEDRVFGRLTRETLAESYDAGRLAALQARLQAADGARAVIGTGAALVHPGDVLVVADLPRWERQLRLRAGEPNWRADNGPEDILRKYKRGYFWEWPVADRHKRTLLARLDFLLDTTRRGGPVLVSGEALQAGLQHTLTRPFRVVPFFDPGVWGGQWMKEVCDLDRSAPNYAWCFDCVPEENSLRLGYGEITLEIPAQDLVMMHPQALLGERTVARFGEQFPIRFDFLDTMGGQNLSLQVHPLVQDIQEHFGMPYTQDESYYILDAAEGAVVYLGVQPGVELPQLAAGLQRAQAGEGAFDAARLVNAFPVRRHDHVLIPAGTIHCSGQDTMVLEISATPFIFTFKLWDWGRLGLDGRPRPIHLEEGLRNVRTERDTPWVQRELLHRTSPVAEGAGWREERTGLHELEFIETRRHWFSAPVSHDTCGTVHVLNLVEGRQALVESPSGAFEPFTVHYAETFIVPAQVGAYTVGPVPGSSGELATLQASVRATAVRPREREVAGAGSGQP